MIRGSFVLSLNESYILFDQVINLNNNDEIAIIPPLSGG